MISTLLSLALAMSVSAPAPATVDEVPAGRVTVDIVSANGSGCPVGTTEVEVADDNSTFSVIHRSFTAKVGAGADPTDARKNCQLVLDVQVPSGFTFGIMRADYRGHANLRDGALASQRASYYFQGMADTVTKVHQFRGPLQDDWATSDIVDPGSVIFAPCSSDRFFKINTELRAYLGTSSPSTTSSISMDSPDRNPNGRFHFAWKRC
jgi:hypothetical protein